MSVDTWLYKGRFMTPASGKMIASISLLVGSWPTKAVTDHGELGFDSGEEA